MKPYQNTTNTQILRMEVLEAGESFNTSNPDHNARLILDDSKGHPFGAEYIAIEEFKEFMNSSWLFIKEEDFFKWLMDSKDEICEEDKIEFSVGEFEILQHLEDFRISEYNKSKYIEPLKD